MTSYPTLHGMFPRSLVCAIFLCGVAGAQAECELEHAQESVHVGEIGTFEAHGSTLATRLAERSAQVSIICPKGVSYSLRAIAAGEEAVASNVVNMVNTEGGPVMRMAVVLEIFDGVKVQRRFTDLPNAHYTAVGTGTPQFVSLRLEPEDVGQRHRKVNRRTAPAAGLYRGALKLELKLHR